MSPAFMAALFGLLAAIAAWSIMRDLAAGVARDELYSFAVSRNPIGFLAVIGGKAFVVGFGIAMILYACGLVGDPMKPLRTLFGPFT